MKMEIPQGFKEKTNEGTFWSPEKEGEAIQGHIVKVLEGEFGLQYEVQTETGAVVTPSHKALQARLKECKVGDQVFIRYDKTDLPTQKGHNGTRLYTVAVKE